MADENGANMPKVVKSSKVTTFFNKRLILVFIIGVGLLIAAIAAQKHFIGDDGSSGGRQRHYRAPQASGFADLAAEMRRDRRPVIVIPEERPALPLPITPPTPQARPAQPTPQRIVIERREERVPRPRYFSNRDDAQAASMLRTMTIQALSAQPVVEGFTPQQSEAANAALPAAHPSAMAGGVLPEMDASMLAALMGQPQQADPNRQADKIDFLRNNAAALTPQGYSLNIPIPQQFPYELKAGTIIPGIMMTGINSDLPGNVIAQVSENVRDTATGRHVLIPKGTRVLGVYDSQVTFGQQRILDLSINLTPPFLHQAICPNILLGDDKWLRLTIRNA